MKSRNPNWKKMIAANPGRKYVIKKNQPKSVHFNERGRDMYGRPGKKIPRALDQTISTYMLSSASHHGSYLHHQNKGRCPYCKEAIRLQSHIGVYKWKLPRHKDIKTGLMCKGSECRPRGQTPKKFKNGYMGKKVGEDLWITITVRVTAKGHPVMRRAKLNVPGHPEFGWDPATIKQPPRKGNKLFKKDPLAWISLPSRHLRKALKESSKSSAAPIDEPSGAVSDDRLESEQYPKGSSPPDEDPS